jgi:hypothetical protein
MRQFYFGILYLHGSIFGLIKCYLNKMEQLFSFLNRREPKAEKNLDLRI